MSLSLLCTMSCGHEILKLASQYGDYLVKAHADIKDMRIAADNCDYEKDCYREEVEKNLSRFCKKGEYEKRGYVSVKECESRHPFILLELFSKGKLATVEALDHQEEMNEGLNEYDEAVEDWRTAEREYEEELYECREEYRGAEAEEEEAWEELQDCEESVEDDYKEARKDYEEAWEEYKSVKEDYLDFFQN